MNESTSSRRTIIEVGIVTSPEIVFERPGDGRGRHRVCVQDGKLNMDGCPYESLSFEAEGDASEVQFIIYGVTIGIDFHWQREQDQKFAGSLRFAIDGCNVVAVNRIDIEDYLLSVISSEMNPASPLEYLKAHAIISRSWALARIEDRRVAGQEPRSCCGKLQSAPRVPAHRLFDVCADDHCQRYQGIVEDVSGNVARAIAQTRGLTLRYKGELCDTRFSKCCGGRSEVFSTCWEDEDMPYLQSVEDPYCDCRDTALLSKVLKDYDLETMDFHDWSIRYPSKELSDLVRRRTGIDFGVIEALEPLERGSSGRIKYMRIRGSLKTDVIGKELAIRRALSPSHLKSSWFDVRRDGDDFVLVGRGWGHGVGLCQIGAAAMAGQGYGCEEILKFYYRGAEIV